MSGSFGAVLLSEGTLPARLLGLAITSLTQAGDLAALSDTQLSVFRATVSLFKSACDPVEAAVSQYLPATLAYC